MLGSKLGVSGPDRRTRPLRGWYRPTVGRGSASDAGLSADGGRAYAQPTMGEQDGPLKRAAEEMRNIYANEIARVVSSGEQPAPELIRSWQRYTDAAGTGHDSSG